MTRCVGVVGVIYGYGKVWAWLRSYMGMTRYVGVDIYMRDCMWIWLFVWVLLGLDIVRFIT